MYEMSLSLFSHSEHVSLGSYASYISIVSVMHNIFRFRNSWNSDSSSLGCFWLGLNCVTVCLSLNHYVWDRDLLIGLSPSDCL